MTKRIFTIAMFIVFARGLANAQVPSSPAPLPSVAPSRSVRLSFLPPPMEGTISLGIYDEADQLVRVLHQEAEFDEFSIGADALVTKWDGKDNYDYDLPAGKYSARGFLVAPMKVGAETTTTGGVTSGATSVRIQLVANPLENKERPTVDICAGFDDDDAYLQTIDGLPLVSIAKRQDAKTMSLAAGRDNRSVIVF